MTAINLRIISSSVQERLSRHLRGEIGEHTSGDVFDEFLNSGALLVDDVGDQISLGSEFQLGDTFSSVLDDDLILERVVGSVLLLLTAGGFLGTGGQFDEAIVELFDGSDLFGLGG